MAKYAKHPPKKKWMPITLFASAILLLAAGLIWDSAAKYMQQTNKEALVKAKEFYFSSDILMPVEAEYTYNPGAGGSADIAISLRNHEGLHVSELDVHYSVTVTPLDPEEPAVTVEYSGSQTIPATGKDEKTTVTLKALQPGKSYRVTAVGENGFQKTLSALIHIAPAVSEMYKNTKNNGDHLILTVWNEGLAGTASVTVLSGLIPDATDPILEKIDGTTFTVTLDKNESRAFRFFTTVGYSGNSMPVSHNGTPLDETPLS